MPPEEELPPYLGHSKQRKTPSRDPVVLSRQQQAEANRVKIRSASRAAQEDVEPPARRLPPLAQVVRHGGKKMTPRQERVLGARYGDRFPNQRKTNSPLAAPGEEFRWEAEALKTLQADESTHSDSEEITDMDDLGASLDGAGNNDALAEVLDQLDEEDELASDGDSNDGDYEEDGALEDVSSESAESSVNHEEERHTEFNTQDEPKTHKMTSHLCLEGNFSNSEDMPAAGSFLEGFPVFWSSWDKFYEVFAEFQEATFQLFSCRTSTSVAARNRKFFAEQKKAKKKDPKKTKGRRATGGTLLPDDWELYSRTYLCTHGMPFDSKGTGQREHTTVRSTGLV
ncbi:hypothetical protein GN244_ATG08330 [Phytophthora infestans]|uniref:Uncharacterized protein n=1 Tax=Phytophthora infestans TaxID=4787 RepID=A0A833W299_PHYIN|nr:hypothetical protein GN244_ATG08330 [Phytophthora infestans]